MELNFSFRYDGNKFDGSNIRNSHITLDKNTVISFEKKEYTEFNASESLLWFENIGNGNSGIISEVNDLDMVLPLGIDVSKRKEFGYIPDKNNVCVISMNGMVEAERYWENAGECAKEYIFNHDYLCKLSNMTKSFENRGGRSSDKLMPFFDVTLNDSGYILAIGWSGDWKIKFVECDDGVSVMAGLKKTNFYLKPEEKIRTASILVMKYSNKEDKYNKFRRLIKKHYSHISNTKAEKEGILAVEFFGSTVSGIMTERIRELAKNDIKFEELWIDAGWYGKCQPNNVHGWDACVGDWNINKEIHPNKLKDISKIAKENGMKLMFWLEPERARSNSKVFNEHSDWFLSLPENTNHILNYGNKEAIEYAYNMISNYIKELGLGCYRQDFNVELTEFFEHNDEPDRRGITEIKHIMGMYKLWDRVLKENPGLLIDNCASGGRRFDIETLKRSIPFFRSDYLCNNTADPEVVQIQNNAAKYLPYVGCCNKVMDLYALRSSYAASFGFMGWSRADMKMSIDDFNALRTVTEEYKKIRKYFSKDYYSHGADVYDTTSWTIWQYHDAETDSGVIIAFRRSNSPFDNVQIKLSGLSENQKYVFENFDTGEVSCHNSEIKLVLTEKASSTVIEYKRKINNQWRK